MVSAFVEVHRTNHTEQPLPPFPLLRSQSRELVAFLLDFLHNNKLFFSLFFFVGSWFKTISIKKSWKSNLKLNFLQICQLTEKYHMLKTQKTQSFSLEWLYKSKYPVNTVCFFLQFRLFLLSYSEICLFKK